MPATTTGSSIQDVSGGKSSGSGVALMACAGCCCFLILGAGTVLVLALTGVIDFFGMFGMEVELELFKVQTDQTYMAEIDKQIIDVLNEGV